MRKALLILGAVVVAAFAAVVVDSLWAARHYKYQRRTMADLRRLGNALDERASHLKTHAFTPADRSRAQGAYGDLTPLRRVSYKELERALTPRYMKKVPRYDWWGNEIEVRVARDAYAIRSPGKDGRNASDRYVSGYFSGLDADLVYSDGLFVQIPEGI
jgi:hypothetical protein